jgi:hypothetical protein
VPRLSAATAPEWCEILRLAQRGAGQPLDPAMVEMGAPEGEMHCAEAPPDGYAREITGIVDGDPVTLRVSARFGGAVDSLRWRGREFLNIYDHGRQISYAWHLDDHGECLNPTEPGSAADGFAQSSTTEVLAICSDGPNRLSTRVLPAYWLGPGERGARRSMLALYELEPTDLRPDEGSTITDAPGEAMVVDVFRSTEGGERGLLFSVEAGAYPRNTPPRRSR